MITSIAVPEYPGVHFRVAGSDGSYWVHISGRGYLGAFDCEVDATGHLVAEDILTHETFTDLRRLCGTLYERALHETPRRMEGAATPTLMGRAIT